MFSPPQSFAFSASSTRATISRSIFDATIVAKRRQRVLNEQLNSNGCRGIGCFDHPRHNARCHVPHRRCVSMARHIDAHAAHRFACDTHPRPNRSLDCAGDSKTQHRRHRRSLNAIPQATMTLPRRANERWQPHETARDITVTKWNSGAMVLVVCLCAPCSTTLRREVAFASCNSPSRTAMRMLSRSMRGAALCSMAWSRSPWQLAPSS